jgi:hypothetical protein
MLGLIVELKMTLEMSDNRFSAEEWFYLTKISVALLSAACLVSATTDCTLRASATASSDRGRADCFSVLTSSAKRTSSVSQVYHQREAARHTIFVTL